MYEWRSIIPTIGLRALESRWALLVEINICRRNQLRNVNFNVFLTLPYFNTSNLLARQSYKNALVEVPLLHNGSEN